MARKPQDSHIYIVTWDMGRNRITYDSSTVAYEMLAMLRERGHTDASIERTRVEKSCYDRS